MTSLGLYIHIPFCSKKCDYCDFTSFCMGKTEQQAYLNALEKEIGLVKTKFKDKTFNTIFIGGGTPSVVFDGFILRLSKKIFASFNIEKSYEFTIEVNPNSFNKAKLDEYVLAGVNRISVGVQNISEKVVNGVGRFQTKKDVENTFNLVKNSPIKNVSADIILGLPNESLYSVKNTVKFLLQNGVTHISSYTLQLEEGTPLERAVTSKQIEVSSDEEIVKQYNAIYKMLKKAGFVRYEISNYAKPHFECKHNQKYWDNSEYLGLGLAAHSYINGVRSWHAKNIKEYIGSINSGNLPTKQENLSNEQRRTERIMLSLRTREGLNLKAFEKEFKEDLLSTRKTEIARLIKLNMIELKNGNLRILDDKFSVSNSIILELL